MDSTSDQTSFRHFSDQLRLQTSTLANLSIGGADNIWSDAFLSSNRRRNLDFLPETARNQNLTPTQNPKDPFSSDSGVKNGSFGWKGNNGYLNKEVSRSVGRKNVSFNEDFGGKGVVKKKSYGNGNNNDKNGADKRFKTLPASEALPRSEAVGGYIFVCNNDTMPENLNRQLFGLPPRYRDSVRAITPGLPLFLYNYSTHQLHGLFQAASFGGSNIDPAAWEDKKCPGESRFPAQVRAKTKKIYEPLEEDSFRPILHHYDGPKFRLELSVPEALALLDKFEEHSA